MIFDKRKMLRVLKLATTHLVKRMKRNKQLLLCEAPKWGVNDQQHQPPALCFSSASQFSRDELFETFRNNRLRFFS